MLPLPLWESAGVRGNQFPHRIPPSPLVGEGRGEGKTSGSPDHPPLTPPIKSYGGEGDELTAGRWARGLEGGDEGNPAVKPLHEVREPLPPERIAQLQPQVPTLRQGLAITPGNLPLNLPLL